jgi:hypothetical protein
MTTIIAYAITQVRDRNDHLLLQSVPIEAETTVVLPPDEDVAGIVPARGDL